MRTHLCLYVCMYGLSLLLAYLCKYMCKWGYVQVQCTGVPCLAPEGWEGSPPKCDNLLKAVTLNKGTSPAIEVGSFIITHVVVEQIDRQKDRQTDKREIIRETCHACSERICLFVELTCTCCPRATGLQWKAVLKMTHICSLSLGTTDWRIRPDTV